MNHNDAHRQEEWPLGSHQGLTLTIVISPFCHCSHANKKRRFEPFIAWIFYVVKHAMNGGEGSNKLWHVLSLETTYPWFPRIPLNSSASTMLNGHFSPWFYMMSGICQIHYEHWHWIAKRFCALSLSLSDGSDWHRTKSWLCMLVFAWKNLWQCPTNWLECC